MVYCAVGIDNRYNGVLAAGHGPGQAHSVHQADVTRLDAPPSS